MKFALALGASIISIALSSTSVAQDSKGNYYARTQIATAKKSSVPQGNHNYEAGNWSDWTSMCSVNSIRTRSVICKNEQGDPVPDANCVGIRKPAQTEASAIYSGCSYKWETGQWSDPTSLCSPTSLQTRSVICRRSDNVPAPDTSCSGVKPEQNHVQANYSGCSYEWEASEWSDWSSNCSDIAKRERDVVCKQVQTGTTAQSSLCTGAKPLASETASRFEACTNDWEVGSWSLFSSTCSDTSARTRSVRCLRSDGKPLADAQCSGEKPAPTEVKGVYETCGYSWGAKEWGEFDAQCSMAAKRSGPAVCIRSDGAVVSDSFCSTANPGVITETKANYAGCGHVWLHKTATIVSNEKCLGSVATNVTYGCYTTDTKAAAANANCTAAGLGSLPSAAKVNLPCTELPNPKYVSMRLSAGTTPTKNVVNYREYSGSFSVSEAADLALQICNEKFDYSYSNATCYVNHYYNAEKGVTIIQAGQTRNYASQPNLTGFNLLNTGNAAFVNPTWSIDIKELIASGGADVRLNSCGSTFSTRSAGGFSFNANLQCIK